MNAVEIEQAISELALQPFDAGEFPFAFLAAFGNKETAIKRLRIGNNNASDIPGGVLQRNEIHIAVCEVGSVGETLEALHTSSVTTKARLTDPDMGPLFGDAPEPDDIESGTIYVLRSLSGYPFVAEHRELIHKIGVTGGKVQARVAAAAKDATYLLADVEVVATYSLHNLNRTRLENIFRRLFGAAQLHLTIEDRFGHPVKPREWFLVPLHVIDEAVQHIRDGSITDVAYNPTTARLISMRAEQSARIHG